MKFMIALLLLCAGIQLSAQTILQQFTALSAGAGQTSDMDLIQATVAGSTLIAMPELLSPGVKVVSISDNAPDGGNVYKQIKNASSSCSNRSVDIWYCENCKPGVTELKFHLSDHVRGSINTFLEVSGLALSSTLDSDGAHINDAPVANDGREVGPKLVTTGTDFVIARRSSTPFPSTISAVTPSEWVYKPTYVYGLNLPAGAHQPTIIGAKSGTFCLSMAAFKVAERHASLEQH
jgi:hypothetical protein